MNTYFILRGRVSMIEADVTLLFTKNKLDKKIFGDNLSVMKLN